MGGGKICPLVTVPYMFLTSFISILGNSSAKVGNIFETTKKNKVLFKYNFVMSGTVT